MSCSLLKKKEVISVTFILSEGFFLTFLFYLNVPSQHKYVTSKEVLILVSKMSTIGLKLKSRQAFFKTLPRPLPGGVFKTCLSRIKTSPRLFLAKGKDNLETIYGIFFSVGFKQHTYYLSINEKLIALSWINYIY